VGSERVSICPISARPKKVLINRPQSCESCRFFCVGRLDGKGERSAISQSGCLKKRPTLNVQHPTSNSKSTRCVELLNNMNGKPVDWVEKGSD
jgi:hypothetical protein